MTELLTAAQMRAVEIAAIESGEVTGLELMERAGRGVVEAVFEEWPDLAKTSYRAVVFCGPGNNGGDGFVVARLLKEWGWEVEVFLYGDPEKLPLDAKTNYERWTALGEVSAFNGETTDQGGVVCESDLFIDALFGTGLARAVCEPTELYWLVYNRWGRSHREVEQFRPRIVSVDMPSGVCSDSGQVLVSTSGDQVEINIQANLTVTFHRQKVGHHVSEGAFCSGKTVIKDIGIKGHEPSGAGDEIFRLVDGTSLDGPRKTARTHKYSHGHALILSGGSGKTGAARLAARGALRIGAGLVTLGVPGSAQMEVASQATAIMLKRAGTPDELAKVLEDDRFNAVCLGPGLGMNRARELVSVACGGVKPRPTVLDADALTSFSDDPAELFGMLHEGCVLTPHGGEFSRLFPDIAEKLNAKPTKGPAYSKVDATREAAKRAGCVVVFKGPDTVIASPDGRCSINSAHYERAAPWLATAGSGDVLAGFITGLLARGFDSMQAAETAAWLHVECARRFGPGLIAEDIPEELPRVLRDLERDAGHG